MFSVAKSKGLELANTAELRKQAGAWLRARRSKLDSLKESWRSASIWNIIHLFRKSKLEEVEFRRSVCGIGQKL